MATQSSRIVHSDEKRHKCNKCGAVRYESNMEKLHHRDADASYAWGNDMKCWRCKRECWRRI